MIALLTKVSAIKGEIEEALAASFSEETELSKAISYSLSGGGKRIRPMIVYLVADALGHGLKVKDAALAAEFFHTASLIADDLPCMDNDDFRRSKLSLHKVYGETIALLASYSLISEGFHKIYENGKVMEREGGVFSAMAQEATLIALECASRCSGVKGAALGQFYDLFPKSEDLEFIEEVIYLKTVTLFEGSFVMGWVFGGGDPRRLGEVKRLAFHFGMAFQIRDDIHDADEDAAKIGHANLALKFGRKEAQNRFEREIEKAETLLQDLGLSNLLFQTILKKLKT